MDEELINIQEKMNNIHSQFEEDKRIAFEEHREICARERELIEPLKKRFDELAKQYIESGRPASDRIRLRRTRQLEIDETKLPQEYFKTEVDKKKLNERLKQSEFTEPIEGVKVGYRTSLFIN